MTDFDSLLSRLSQDLASHGVRWALIGGHSVAVRCEPRFTKDIDVAIAVRDDSEAESIVRWMAACGYRVRAVIEQTASKRLATVRLSPPGSAEGPMIDLLFASSGIEPEVVSNAEVLEVFPGTCAPVATLPHLLALKILSRDDVQRPQDRLDLRALLLGASPDDMESTRRALDLILERGAHRGRDLAAALEAALQELGPKA